MPALRIPTYNESSNSNTPLDIKYIKKLPTTTLEVAISATSVTQQWYIKVKIYVTLDIYIVLLISHLLKYKMHGGGASNFIIGASLGGGVNVYFISPHVFFPLKITQTFLDSISLFLHAFQNVCFII